MDFAQLSDSQRGCSKIEQLNIVGKRSGDGFVAHKATLVNVLSRVMAERLLLMDFTIGRKGFAGYIKALSGSNIVKIVPANGNASGSQVTDKRLKVVCGANTSYLEDTAWVGDNTPVTFAEVRVSPNNTVKPNIGSIELAEALNRVLPFTATDDARPVLQCVKFVAGEGKLKLVGADGFRLAEVTLDYDEDIEGQVLIHRDELKGITGALRKAKRVRLGFEASGETLHGMSLVIDTEAIRFSCMHCLDAPCIKVCPRSAIYKDGETGITLVNPEKCIGCKFCLWVCPYGAPQFQDGKLKLCNLCIHRLREGNQTACQAACQARAIHSGTAEEISALKGKKAAKRASQENTWNHTNSWRQ